MRLPIFCLLALVVSCNLMKNESIVGVCFNTKQSDTLAVIQTSQLHNFDGEIVRVKGIFINYFEDVALYPQGNKKSESAFWLNFTDELASRYSEVRKLHSRTVELYGRVNMKRKGHLSSYAGSIDTIFCIKPV